MYNVGKLKMNARESAFNILMTFERTGQRLEIITDRELLRSKTGEKEKKFIYNLTSGVVRNVYLFDWKISMLFKGQYKKALIKFKVILRLALYEIDCLDHIPPHATIHEYVNLTKKKINLKSGGIVNGILRNYLREGNKLLPEKNFKFNETIISIKYSFPEWIIKRWISFWGEEETKRLCSAFNDRPKFDIRINLKKISNDDFCHILNKHGISFERSEYFPNVLKVTDIQKIHTLGLFKDGFCSVQDESGQLISDLLEINDGDCILDACAAPGGKFTAILEQSLSNIDLIGLDIDFKRLMKVRENCLRLGYEQCYRLIQGDAGRAPFKREFNKILLDTPCTGFGTIQKHPDIRWRRTLDDVFRFQKYQLKLLEQLSELLPVSGQIIYSTCTIDPAENEEVTNLFLEKNNRKFKICAPPVKFAKFIINDKYIKTFPHKHNMDGSFAVILKRIS